MVVVLKNIMATRSTTRRVVGGNTNAVEELKDFVIQFFRERFVTVEDERKSIIPYVPVLLATSCIDGSVGWLVC